MKRIFQKSVSNPGSIEHEITAIFNVIETNLKEGLVAEKIHPSKGSTFCKGMINIYKAEDIQRKKADKSFKATPVVSYAFYPDTFRPSRIGSVAIYGEKAFSRCFILKKRGFFFGRKIISAKVEYGRRPFVDVRLCKNRHGLFFRAMRIGYFQATAFCGFFQIFRF